MRCPACGFVSFPHLTACKKCGKPLPAPSSQFRLPAPARPAPPRRPAAAPGGAAGTADTVMLGGMKPPPPPAPAEDTFIFTLPPPAAAEVHPRDPLGSAAGLATQLDDRPAGFWIRFVATFIDGLVFIPVVVVSVINLFFMKNLMLQLLLHVPSLLYKPLMEARYGATWGKMAVGVRVVDEFGEKLSVAAAYVRFGPFLLGLLVSLAGSVVIFSSPEYQSAKTLMELVQLPVVSQFGNANNIIQLLVAVECLFAAFTRRKRALHDMLAGSFCVHKA
jgi:uncharacterized RDD family membrane protein YckC